MADRLILEHWWLGPLLWGVLYACDYLLTVTTARRAAGPVGEHLVYEKGIELNPLWQAEVATLRWFSWRFLVVWALTVAIFVPYHFLTEAFHMPQAYAFAAGVLVLLSCVVNARHVSSLITFSAMAEPGAMQGKLFYSYWLSLRVSGAQFLGMGVLRGLMAAVTQSWFVAGGAVECVYVGWLHWRRSVREQAKAPGMPPPPPPPPPAEAG